MNESEDTAYQNFMQQNNAEREIIAVNAYIKEKKFQISNLNFHLILWRKIKPNLKQGERE